MTDKDIKNWLAWRKDIGLPPVSQEVIERVQNECIVMYYAPEPPLKIYTVRKYLWGLITIYKPLKIEKYDFED